MARRVFFSFHYSKDVQRSQVVKKSQFLKDKELAGFFDSSAMEEAKKKDADSLRKFLRKEMEGSSVVCVLIGEETASRRWVRFEILQGLMEGKGILGVRIDSIKDWNVTPGIAGPNPLDLLGVYTSEKKVRVIQRNSASDKWTYTNDFGQDVIPNWPYTPDLPPDGSWPLSKFFNVYKWSNDGHENIGAWVERAAKQARR